MTRLRDVASLMRSKNAGPFELCIDIMFPDTATYQHVVDSGAVNPDAVAAIYGLDPTTVRVFPFPPGDAIKVSFPRKIISGDVFDTDVTGGQHYALLVDLEIPAAPV